MLMVLVKERESERDERVRVYRHIFTQLPCSTYYAYAA